MIAIEAFIRDVFMKGKEVTKARTVHHSWELTKVLQRR